MATIDMNIPRDRVRLAIADTSDLPMLDNSTIEYVLTKNNNNEPASIKECAGYILGILSQNTDSRLDRLQFYGSQAFNNYLVYLKNVVNGTLGNNSFGGIYAAGVDKQDVIDNLNDTTVVHHNLPLHRHWEDCFYVRENPYEFHES